jgi:hypothetical protein
MQGFLLIACLFAGLWVKDFIVSRPLELRGRSIIGKAVDIEYSSNKYHTPHVTYIFSLPHSPAIQGEGIDWHVRIGDKVDVTYLPDDPAHNLLTSDLQRRTGAIFFWGCVTTLCLGGAGISFGLSRYYRRYLRKKKAD